MNSTVRAVFLVAITAVLACSRLKGDELRTTFPDGALLAAYEYFAPRGDHTFVNCLAVEKLDPSAPIIAFLQAEKRDVVPASKCTYVIESSGSYENATKRKALFVRISGLRLERDGSATGNASSYHNGLFGNVGEFRLIKLNGKWKLDKYRPRGIS